MKKTTTPLQTPSPHTERSQTATEVGSENNNTLAGFFSATLTMSWQLAIVVLIPILGGVELDRKFHTVPVMTIIGFIVAVAGVSAIIWRQYRIVSSLPMPQNKETRP